MEHKIRSLYHSTVFLWLVTAFFHIFSFFWVCLCRHFVCFSPVSRPRTQILSLFILAAILNKFPLSVDKSVTWCLLCARVFSPAAAILESEKALGTRLLRVLYCFNNREQASVDFILVQNVSHTCCTKRCFKSAVFFNMADKKTQLTSKTQLQFDRKLASISIAEASQW